MGCIVLHVNHVSLSLLSIWERDRERNRERGSGNVFESSLPSEKENLLSVTYLIVMSFLSLPFFLLGLISEDLFLASYQESVSLSLRSYLHV